MKIRASLSKDGKEVAAQTADVSKPGDLTALVEQVFQEARKTHGGPLWDFDIAVRQA